MTYSDAFNIRTTSVKFNDIADAIDGVIKRQYTTTSGGPNLYIATPTPAWTEYTTSAIIIITPNTSNAAGATIQINSLPAKELRIGGAPIAAGVLQTGVPTILAYTGTYFEVLLQNISIPTGQITAFGGSTAPVGYLLCDGAEYPIATYPTLSSVLGTTYNLGTETLDYFRVPDLQRRYPVGKGASDTLGNAEGGTKAGTAYASRSIQHSHTIPAHYHGMGTGATLSVDISHTHSSGSAVTGTIGSASDGTHTHTLSGDGTHDHDLRQEAGGGGTADGSAANIISLVGSTVTAYRNSSNHYNGGGHSHTVNSTNSGHTHNTFNLTAAGQTLSSTPKTPTGTIGLVTGGVDGNIQQSTGPVTPPHLFVNYIIKT
jgi:microcystin-dependent protein